MCSCRSLGYKRDVVSALSFDRRLSVVVSLSHQSFTFLLELRNRNFNACRDPGILRHLAPPWLYWLLLCSASAFNQPIQQRQHKIQRWILRKCNDFLFRELYPLSVSQRFITTLVPTALVHSAEAHCWQLFSKTRSWLAQKLLEVTKWRHHLICIIYHLHLFTMDDTWDRHKTEFKKSWQKYVQVQWAGLIF